MKPYDWAPDTVRWVVSADAYEGVEEERYIVTESRLVPLPYPGMTGVAYVGPPAKPKRRRVRPKAKTATA
jgi:hypothetical protein